jgi:hypothetical protein
VVRSELSGMIRTHSTLRIVERALENRKPERIPLALHTHRAVPWLRCPSEESEQAPLKSIGYKCWYVDLQLPLSQAKDSRPKALKKKPAMACAYLRRCLDSYRSRRSIPSCRSWIHRLNTKVEKDERRQNKRLGLDDHMQSGLSLGFKHAGYYFLAHRQIRFQVTVIDYALAKEWAQSHVAKDRVHLKNLEQRVPDLLERLPMRRWDWCQLQKWYMNTCWMGGREEGGRGGD